MTARPKQPPTSETSPLLGTQRAEEADLDANANGVVVDPENGQPEAENESDETVLADEPGTAKLVAVMASVWTGVFFAALGEQRLGMVVLGWY